MLSVLGCLCVEDLSIKPQRTAGSERTSTTQAHRPDTRQADSAHTVIGVGDESLLPCLLRSLSTAES